MRDFTTFAAASDRESLHRAEALYRDDFMAGFTLRDAPDYDDWLHFTADGLRQQFAAVLGRLVTLAVGSGDLDAATGHARRWLAVEPLHEPAHQALIQLYAWTGQRSAALQQYRACVRVLDRELGVGPLQETARLADAVRADRLGPPPQRTSEAAPQPAAAAAPAVPDVALVGRATALTAIRITVASAVGSGQVVEVTGPVGIGKTRVLAEIAGEVRRRGGRALATRCHEREHGLAYGLVVDLLRVAAHSRPGLANSLSVHIRVRKSGGWFPRWPGNRRRRSDRWMGRVQLPGCTPRSATCSSLRPRWGPTRTVPPRSPSTTRIGLTRHRPSGSPGCSAACPTFRSSLGLGHVGDFAADSPLPAALAATLRRASGTVVALYPLDRDDVAAVLTDTGGKVSGQQLDHLYRETGGLPFLVVAYAHALGTSPQDGDLLQLTPTDVRTALLARLASVSEMTQQILAGAAVLGGRVDLDLLRSTSGRGESETVDAVEIEAVHAGLPLVELPATASGPAYDFAAAALARVVDGRIGAARRRLLHGRAADALLHRPDRAAATVAVHLHAAGRVEESAGWHWQAASEARALFAHAEALAHVQEALALGHPAAEAHLVAGELLTTLGRYREALASYEAAAAALDVDGDGTAIPRLAIVDHRLADVHQRLADYDVAEVRAGRPTS